MRFITALACLLCLLLPTGTRAQEVERMVNHDSFAYVTIGAVIGGIDPLVAPPVFKPQWGAGFGQQRYKTRVYWNVELEFTSSFAYMAQSGGFRYRLGKDWVVSDHYPTSRDKADWHRYGRESEWKNPVVSIGVHAGVAAELVLFDTACAVDRQATRTLVTCGVSESSSEVLTESWAYKSGPLAGVLVRRARIGVVIEGSLQFIPTGLLRMKTIDVNLSDEQQQVPIELIVARQVFIERHLALRLMLFSW